jgi:hypothetical protein
LWDARFPDLQSHLAPQKKSHSQLAATSDDEASRANAVAMLGCVAQLQSHRSNLADVAKILLHAATKDMSWG